MANALVPQEKQRQVKSILDRYTEEERQLLEKELAPGCTATELAYGLTVASELGLNPFAKQIYFIKYEGKEPKMQIIIGIDGYRAIAARQVDTRGIQTYAGSEIPILGPFVKDTGVTTNERPAHVDCTVYKMLGNARVAFNLRTHWGHVVAKNNDRTYRTKWREDPEGMLQKAGEAAVLRQAFPSDMWKKASAIYDEPAPAYAVDVQTGEILLPEKAQAASNEPAQRAPVPEPETQTPRELDLLSLCPIHGVDWFKRGAMRNYGHPTGEKTPEGKDAFCNRPKVLIGLFREAREALEMSQQEALEWCKQRWGKAPSDLTDEEICLSIAALRALKETAQKAPASSQEAASPGESF